MGAGLEAVPGCASVVCGVEEGRIVVGRSRQGGKDFGSLVAGLGCEVVRWQCQAVAMQTRVGRGTCCVVLLERGRALRRYLEVATVWCCGLERVRTLKTRLEVATGWRCGAALFWL